jgi:hypothetical protein
MARQGQFNTSTGVFRFNNYALGASNPNTYYDSQMLVVTRDPGGNSWTVTTDNPAGTAYSNGADTFSAPPAGDVSEYSVFGNRGGFKGNYHTSFYMTVACKNNACASLDPQ